MQYKIGIVPLTDFVHASEAKKRRIVKEQKRPNPFTVPLYRTVKSVLPKYFKNDYDKSLIVQTIERLQQSDQSTDWKRNNVSNSIVALRHFMRMEFPEKLSRIKCNFLPKVDVKNIVISHVNVYVQPDVIFRWEEDGKKYLGGIKFHIGKTKPLDNEVGRLRASLLSYYLLHTQAKEGEIVNNHFCFCVDVIHENVFRAPVDTTNDIIILRGACSEVVHLWGRA